MKRREGRWWRQNELRSSKLCDPPTPYVRAEGAVLLISRSGGTPYYSYYHCDKFLFCCIWKRQQSQCALMEPFWRLPCDHKLTEFQLLTITTSLSFPFPISLLSMCSRLNANWQLTSNLEFATLAPLIKCQVKTSRVRTTGMWAPRVPPAGLLYIV
jgi:hypothetical protein